MSDGDVTQRDKEGFTKDVRKSLCMRGAADEWRKVEGHAVSGDTTDTSTTHGDKERLDTLAGREGLWRVVSRSCRV